MTNRYRLARRFAARFIASLAAALLCVALGHSAVATAEPVWDIKAYDDCERSLDDGMDNTVNWINTAAQYCCKHSGGVWNDYQNKCVSPPAEGQGAGPQMPRPPRGELPLIPVNPPKGE